MCGSTRYYDGATLEGFRQRTPVATAHLIDRMRSPYMMKSPEIQKVGPWRHRAGPQGHLLPNCCGKPTRALCLSHWIGTP